MAIKDNVFERYYQFSDKEKEEHVIYSCLMDKDAILKIFDLLELEDFAYRMHRYLWEGVISCLSKNVPIDIISVIEECRRLGYKEEDVSNYAVIQICERFPSSASVLQSANKLKMLSRGRRYIKSLYKDFGPHDDIDEIIADHQKELLDITFENKPNQIDLREEIDEIEQSMQRRIEGKELIGYPWTSSDLTKITGGIEPNYVYVYGAREKSGKSKWIIDNYVNLAEHEVHNLVLSMEMIRTQVSRWTWSRVAEVDSLKFKNPKLLTDEDKRRLKLAKEYIRDKLYKYIHIDDRPGLRIIDFKAKIINWLHHIGDQGGIVWLDFLQRFNMEIKRGESKAEAIERTTRAFADITKGLPISLVYMSQLKKRPQGEKNDFNDLLGSGGIAQNANVIILANNLDRIYLSKNKPENDGITELNILQRDGENALRRVRHHLDTGIFHDEREVWQSKYDKPATPF